MSHVSHGMCGVYVCECVSYAALKRKTEKEYETRTQKMVRLNWPSSCGSSFMRDPFVRLQLFKICTILIKHHSFFFFFVYILIIQWFCRDVAGCAGATFHRILVTLYFVIILCTFFFNLFFFNSFLLFSDFLVSIRMFHCQLYRSITATEKRRIRYIKNTRSLAHIHAFLFLPLFYADSREKQFCDNCIISDIDRRINPVCRTRKDLRLCVPRIVLS